MNIRAVPHSQGKDGRTLTSSLDLLVLGMCTGTGLGYLDCALVRFSQTSPSTPLREQLQQFDRIPVPVSIKTPIVDSFRNDRRNSESTTQPNQLLSRLFSGGIETFCRKHALEPSSIDLVGMHSDALWHLKAASDVEGEQGHPLQWISLMTAETGISTVFDFKITERAVVRPHIHPTTYVNRVFLRHPTKFRVYLDIDEITNLSFIPPHGDNGARPTISQDCGPGSLLIDYAMRYCTSNNQSDDHDGDLGALGKINQKIVDQFLKSHDYLRKTPSMSIATEMFGNHEAQQLIDECLYNGMSEADTIATITRATAQNILNQYNRLLKLCFPPDQHVDELFICGPGAHNTNIIDYLESKLPESVITKPLHDIGIPGDAHEAVCYAHLALEAVLNQITQTTDPATLDAVSAKVVPGQRWDDLRSHVLGFSGGRKVHVPTDVRIVGSLEAAVQRMTI
ncbi:hypothetical protein OPT61_g7131 [Boeremia exigua]|uniref:Uncharacterized protein n=1 Tax=Boeremia exigua TaxID=749465 RepID=A0ACC2I3U6_9PLEO|nr:hypothetical protein OPT61_g7131 [Boeremia exigua]